MTAAEISQQLSLTSIKDHGWHIQACCALTGEGSVSIPPTGDRGGVSIYTAHGGGGGQYLYSSQGTGEGSVSIQVTADRGGVSIYTAHRGGSISTNVYSSHRGQGRGQYLYSSQGTGEGSVSIQLTGEDPYLYSSHRGHGEGSVILSIYMYT